jgi:hypothetical protein
MRLTRVTRGQNACVVPSAYVRVCVRACIADSAHNDGCVIGSVLVPNYQVKRTRGSEAHSL